MPINERITRQNAIPMVISCVLLLGVWISVLLHVPVAAYRNPPYHRFGGFDFSHWWAGWAIYGGQLVIALLLRRSRYGYRPILSVVIAILVVCLMIHVGSFLFALGEPTL